MAEYFEPVRVPMQITQSCLVASIQTDLDDMMLEQFQKDLLERIRQSRAHGVILDLSGVEVIDAYEFESLRRTLAMAKLMGTRCVVAGLRPGVVASLVEMDVDCSGLQATLDLQDALALLRQTERAEDGDFE